MRTLITRIKRLALALCFVTPLVSWAATITGYEDFGDVAGVQLWRTATDSGVTDFAFAKFAAVATDGTVGETYTQNTSTGTHWRRWASKFNNGDNSAHYTAPGLVLVYDQAGLMATPSKGATFAPLSFGGLWVKELGANDTPYGLTDEASKSRVTEFGATGCATLFKFEKSFTINRGAASTFYGTATVNITGDAVFTASTGHATVVDADATLKLTGDSTAAMSVGAGLTVNGTLDLTASTRPTISGNVRFAGGSSLVLPEGTATGEAISVAVCSGTLTADGVVSVKIGSADPINAALTISGGTITQIDETVVEKTYTSDYPSVVPAGYTYTFTTSAATTLPDVTVTGTLKTEGDFTITDLKVAAGGTLEVVSGNTTVGGAAACQIKGNVTVDAGATLTNTLTDSLDYNGTMTVDVYGTLAMGSTRWSIPSSCTFKLHGGASVTGTGDTLASLDIINANGQGLDVYAGTSPNVVTIEGPVRVRANETRFWVASGTTLVLQSGIVEKNQQPGSFKQTGPGTLEICATQTGLTGGTSTFHQGTLRLNNTTTAIPLAFNSSAALEIVATDAATTVPVNVTSIYGNGVTLTGSGKANGSITKTAEPGGDLATFLQSSAWEGTFVADWAGANGTRFDINSYGNANSTVRVTKLVGGYVSGSNANVTVVPTVEVSAGGFMTLDNGYSGKITTLTKLTGSGVFTNKTYSVDVTTLDNFTGTLATLIGKQYLGMQIGTINLSATPAAGAKIVNITSDSNIGNIEKTKVSVNGVVDDTIALEVKSDGIYVAVPSVDVTVPVVDNTVVTVTVGGETVSPKTEGGNVYSVAPGSVVTVTYAAADGYKISGTTEYTVDTASATTFEITDTATAQYVARVRNYGTNKNEDFTSLNAAIAVADGTTYANTITLLADIADAVTIDKSIFLAGQGKTISAAVTISSGGYLSLMGPTLTGKLTIGANGALAQVGTGSVLPEVETQDGASIALSTLSADTVALTVTTLTVNGTLTLSSNALGTERGTPYKAFSYVTDNATFGEGAEIVGGGVYSASTEVEGDNTVVSMTITAVAKIGDEYYDDLDEAVEDAIANDTVVDLIIQPEAAVTLGAGETLKVRVYSFTLEVNLASGLTNPPYSISSDIDTDTTISTYTVNEVAPIKYYNTWNVPNVFYFDDEDPVPSRTTQGTVPTIKREGETSYHAAEAWVVKTWTVTASNAADASTPDNTIATVDENGLVTFTAPGTVKVWLTMTDPSGAAKSASKTVKYALAPAVVVSADGQTKTAYATLLAAFNGAKTGETVVLGADATVGNIGKMELKDGRSITLDLNGHTVTFNANYGTNVGSLFNIKSGSLAVVDTGATKGGIAATGTGARVFSMETADEATTALSIGEGVNVSSAHEVCVYLQGNATLTTAGNLTAASDFAIAGNGSPGNGGTTVNVTGGTVTGDEIAIYQPQNGALTISGGAITGGTAVYVKSGTVSVTGGTITGNGAAADYVFNGSGANATGDAIVIDNAGYPGGAPVPSITGGTITSVNASAIASYSKSGYSRITKFAAASLKTSSITEAVASSADVFDDYVDTVPVDAGAQTEPVDTQAEAEADAAKVVPSVPDAVAAKLSDEQETAYKALFEAKVVTVTVGETTKYAVEVALKADVVSDLQTAVDAEAEDLATAAVAAAADSTNGGEATVTTTPGLYYVVEAGTEPGVTEPKSCTLAESNSTKLTIPNQGTKGFYKIRVSVTPVVVQE